MAFRTFVGACATTVSSIVNLTVLTAIHGEPGWICLMLCNADGTYYALGKEYKKLTDAVLFSVLVLHWVTTFDQTGNSSNRSRTGPSGNDGHGTATHGTNLGTRRNSIDEIQLLDDVSKRGVVESNVQGNFGGPKDSKKGTIMKAVVVTQETSLR